MFHRSGQGYSWFYFYGSEWMINIEKVAAAVAGIVGTLFTLVVALGVAVIWSKDVWTAGAKWGMGTAAAVR